MNGKFLRYNWERLKMSEVQMRHEFLVSRTNIKFIRRPN